MGAPDIGNIQKMESEKQLICCCFHKFVMENIIQFLIDESRRYLRIKNSHNLTLKKNTGFPHRRSQQQKERHGRGAETKDGSRHPNS